jgi:hypothetical protein
VNTTQPVPHKREPKPPKRWWHGANWSVILRVPGALLACASVMAGILVAIRKYRPHITDRIAVLACAGAVILLCVAGFPVLRKLFRALVGGWVRVVHRHRDQGEARLKHPRYHEIHQQPALLGMSTREASRAVGLSARVFLWLQRHPGVLVHEELIRHLCEAMLLDPDYVRGVRHDFSDPYVERRLFHYWSRGLARAWTWSEIMEATPEARRQILASIEALRWAEIHAQNPGGDDA